MTTAIAQRPSVIDLIGHTPLVRLDALETNGSRLYAKLEWQNPGGSVKDRAAARMIVEGERSGALAPGGTILDATSGNTGIAYAMLGAALGYRVRLCVPANVTPERLRMLRAFGAEVVLTDPMDGSDGAIREARAIHAARAAPVLSRPVQQRRQLAGALRHDRRSRSGNRPAGGSRTSSPVSAPAARSSARHGGCARSIHGSRRSRCSPTGRCTASRG